MFVNSFIYRSYLTIQNHTSALNPSLSDAHAAGGGRTPHPPLGPQFFPNLMVSSWSTFSYLYIRSHVVTAARRPDY